MEFPKILQFYIHSLCNFCFAFLMIKVWSVALYQNPQSHIFPYLYICYKWLSLFSSLCFVDYFSEGNSCLRNNGLDRIVMQNTETLHLNKVEIQLVQVRWVCCLGGYFANIASNKKKSQDCDEAGIDIWPIYAIYPN